jgi:hypothetical protein
VYRDLLAKEQALRRELEEGTDWRRLRVRAGGIEEAGR